MLALRTLLVFALASAIAAPVYGQKPEAPYPVTVWARVTFDQAGRVASQEIIDAETYPSEFAASVQARVAKAAIPPPLDNGEPATLQSGVRLDFTITPAASGASVTMDGLSMGPIPIKQYFASYPKEVAFAGGWSGEIAALCRVGTDGRCAEVTIEAVPGIPESVRRFAKISLEGWLFEPQQLNGVAIEGEYRLSMKLDTPDVLPEDFRQDKFQRIINSR